MKITKFEHACFAVEENGQSLVVDPGSYTTDFVVREDVVAVFITHNHPDHLNKEHLNAIVAKNPDAVIYGPVQVTDELKSFKTQTVTANEGVKAGQFELEFFGGDHAVIVNDMNIDQNLGIMINGRIYYPGDSFTVPERSVEILALPVGGPWLKMSEAAEFLQAVRPKLAFPTHDAVLSDNGRSLPDGMLPGIAETVGTKYQRLIEPLII